METSPHPPSECSLRIAHVTEAPGGGVLSYLQEVVGHQARTDSVTAITVLGPEVNAGPMREIDSPKLVVESFEHERGSPAGLLRLAASLRRIVQDNKPDILNVHSTFAGVVARLAILTVRARPKVVYCPHSWAFSRSGSFRSLAAAVERVLAFLTDRIVCVSRAELRDAVSVGIPEAKCVVIENGIRVLPGSAGAPQARRSGDGRRLRVLFVGRFDRQKGFDFFLDVMARLGGRAEGLAVGDYVVGHTDSALAIPENVTLLGWRSRAEVLQLYREADVLLMPSRWEGLPIVALEAMRSGLPVFATPAGGLQDVVVDGVTGRLFDLADAGRVADMIRSASPEALEEYGRRGYQRFLERFTADRMNREILDLYRSLLEPADRARAPAGGQTPAAGDMRPANDASREGRSADPVRAGTRG